MVPMNMKTIAATLTLLLGLATASFSQQAEKAPGQTDALLGLRLIAWSEMQKPQPLPQRPDPLPPPDDRKDPSQRPQPPDQPGQKSEQQPEPETQESTAQSITGTIAKVGEKYVLETSENLAYQLDDQDKAKQYEGKRVKVRGTLDKTTGTIHIQAIELLS